MPCAHCGWSGVIGKRGAEKGIVKGLCKNCYYYQRRTGRLEREPKGPSPCSIDGCGKPVVSHGYCDMHWGRVKATGDPNKTLRPEDWGKKEKHPLYQSWRWLCRKNGNQLCERWSDFWLFVADIGNRPTEIHKLCRVDESKQYGPDNFVWRETEVIKLREESELDYRRRYMKEYAQKHPDRIKNTDLKKRYGIGLKEYEEMMVAQGGKCAICRREETARNHRTGGVRKLAVDHCHAKGNVRKLLCVTCNRGLGSFDDDPALLRAAADYLEQH